MKMSVIYFSDTGNTKAMAEVIVEGMEQVEGVEAKAFALDAIDKEWATESACIVVGTPVYMANMASQVKAWLEGPCAEYGIMGKIGGAFATANYIHGGGDIAIQSILEHMLVWGMLTYSGGGASGEPVIHLGPVGVVEYLDSCKEVFRIYGERMATKTKELCG